ncbi:MAG: PHP domain-containing protein [Acidobacteriaceae bacterium]|nr:PHP domain-containing protein [Acidobacteriaceae bacterium]
MIDLHCHTTCSDGTSTPAGLICEAAAAGIEAIAVTDHDTIAGYAPAAEAGRRMGIEVICGVELSCKPSAEQMGPRLPSVHILGYFLQGEPEPGFRYWLSEMQRSRQARNFALIARLRDLGVAITIGEVEEIGGSMCGRPHFARILVEKNYASSRQDAFDRYLADGASASVHRDEPSVIEGVERIARGSGIPVLAHPVRLPECDEGGLNAFLSPLIEAGLKGVEVYHSDHSPEDEATFLKVAERHSLVVTGGSDWHGANKPGVALGIGSGRLCLPYSMLDKMRRVQAEMASAGHLPRS